LFALASVGWTARMPPMSTAPETKQPSAQGAREFLPLKSKFLSRIP
jgi:hypothetical protein